MPIKPGNVYAIGPKSKLDRLYRVVKVSHPAPYGHHPAVFLRTVTLTRISSGTTWQVRVKPGAKTIPWNTSIMRVPTDADRAQALKMLREDVFNRLTDMLAQAAATCLRPGYREDLYPAVSRVTYTANGHNFTARVVKGPNLLTWGTDAIDTEKSNDAGDVVNAFRHWCATLT